MLDGQTCWVGLLWFAYRLWDVLNVILIGAYALWHAYCMCPAFVSCAARLKDWATGRNINVTRDRGLARLVSRADGRYVFWTCLVLSTHHWLVGSFLAWPVWLTLAIFAAHTFVMFFLVHVCEEHDMFNKYLECLKKTLLLHRWLYSKCFVDPTKDVQKLLEDHVMNDRAFDAVRTSHLGLLICYAKIPNLIEENRDSIRQTRHALAIHNAGGGAVNDRLKLEEELQFLDQVVKGYGNLEARLFTMRFVLASALPIIAFWCIFIGVGVGVFVGASAGWEALSLRRYEQHEEDVAARVWISVEAQLREIG